MTDVTVDSYRAHLHSPFTVVDGDGRLALTLVEVTMKGAAPDDRRQPFALLFHGPLAPVLPQAIYRFEHGTLPPHEIFIVPVGPAGGSMRYEAIFS